MKARQRTASIALLAVALFASDEGLACEPSQTECGTSGNTYCCDKGKECRTGGGCNDWVQCNKNEHCKTMSCNGSSCDNCKSDTDCGELGECNLETHICEHKPVCLSNGSCGDPCTSHDDCPLGLICTYDKETDEGACTAPLPDGPYVEPSFACAMGTHTSFGAASFLIGVWTMARRIRGRSRRRAAG